MASEPTHLTRREEDAWEGYDPICGALLWRHTLECARHLGTGCHGVSYKGWYRWVFALFMFTRPVQLREHVGTNLGVRIDTYGSSHGMSRLNTGHRYGHGVFLASENAKEKLVILSDLA